MVIILNNCKQKLQPQNLIPTGANIASLEASLQSVIQLTGWTYDFAKDLMEIYVSDGTTIPPSISDYGDVVS